MGIHADRNFAQLAVASQALDKLPEIGVHGFARSHAARRKPRLRELNRGSITFLEHTYRRTVITTERNCMMKQRILATAIAASLLVAAPFAMARADNVLNSVLKGAV